MNRPTLTEEQGGILADLAAFARSSTVREPYLVVHGLAGTGKTTVAAELARTFPSAILCAFTGKAASVLREKTGLDARTIHSVIYDFKGLAADQDDPDKKNPIFVEKGADISGLAIVDEVSMIGERVAEDLLRTGVRVIAFGDPGQLPPVQDRAFFEEPTHTLETIHRQALDSAVIRQAHRIRAGQSYRGDGPDFQVLAGATPDDLRWADVALCWRNATRSTVNVRRRTALGFGGPTLRTGEPVVCLRNDHALKIYNGEVYRVARDRQLGDDMTVADSSGRPVHVLNARVEALDRDYASTRDDDAYHPFAFGYALTVHKAQGSQWDRVLVIDECDPQRGDRDRWLYTAVTRAAKQVRIVA